MTCPHPQTAWLDGSQIYGTDEDQVNSLRSFVDGKLMVKQINGEDFLPGESVCLPQSLSVLLINDKN